MTLFFNMLVLLAGLIVAQPAGAGDLISARAVLEDPSGDQMVYIFSGLSIRGYLAPWVPADFPELADSVSSHSGRPDSCSPEY